MGMACNPLTRTLSRRNLSHFACPLRKRVQKGRCFWRSDVDFVLTLVTHPLPCLFPWLSALQPSKKFFFIEYSIDLARACVARPFGTYSDFHLTGDGDGLAPNWTAVVMARAKSSDHRNETTVITSGHLPMPVAHFHPSVNENTEREVQCSGCHITISIAREKFEEGGWKT